MSLTIFTPPGLDLLHYAGIVFAGTLFYVLSKVLIGMLGGFANAAAAAAKNVKG